MPTLAEGGSTIGTPRRQLSGTETVSPGHQFVVPSITEAEQAPRIRPRLDRLPADHAEPPQAVLVLMELVGNAVTVGVSACVAHRLVHPKRVTAPIRLSTIPRVGR